MGSQLNLVAAVIYGLVALLAACAERTFTRQASTFFRPSWTAIAVLFLGFALWRVIDGEHALHHLLVDGHLNSTGYAERGLIQGPLVLLGGIFGLWLFSRETRRRRRNPWFRLGWAASLALLTLTGLRMISWHALDMILFVSLGPIHLNHVLDIGLAAIVGWSALRFCRRERAGQRLSRDGAHPDSPHFTELHDAH
jgi:hypothetical protein